MDNENLRKAREYLDLFLAENQPRLWPEEVIALNRALVILNRFKTD